MKPARLLLPISTFLMRLGVAFYIYIQYFHHVIHHDFEQLNFYLSTIFTIFALLLIFGAFTRKQTLTVLSGLILFILSLYKIFTFSGQPESLSFVSLLLFGMISFFFVCNGNRGR